MIYGVITLLALVALSVLPHPETIALVGALALFWLVLMTLPALEASLG